MNDKSVPKQAPAEIREHKADENESEQEVLEYWTPERMRDAQPVPLPTVPAEAEKPAKHRRDHGGEDAKPASKP